MSLKIIRANPNLSISYDSQNNWLYLDWCGEQTIDTVREGCLLIAQCFLRQSYGRILNDNTNVTSVTREVFEWLSTEFLPYIHLVQIEYLAWVYPPGMDARSYTDIALYKDSSLVVALFDDLASAYSWLRDVTFKPATVALSPQVTAQRRRELQGLITVITNALDDKAQPLATPSAAD